jgi:hypothetical protein
LAAAKEIQERFGIPAMAVTGHLTAAEAEAAGLLGILSKPYTAHGLQRSSTGRRHGWRAVRPDPSSGADLGATQPRKQVPFGPRCGDYAGS